jgi:hypothetical protein
MNSEEGLRRHCMMRFDDEMSIRKIVASPLDKADMVKKEEKVDKGPPRKMTEAAVRLVEQSIIYVGLAFVGESIPGFLNVEQIIVQL